MKLGELADLLRELYEAEQQVKDCTQALGYGGNPQTMERKHQALQAAESQVEWLREQELP